jgi:hypothetical protein
MKFQTDRNDEAIIRFLQIRECAYKETTLRIANL